MTAVVSDFRIINNMKSMYGGHVLETQLITTNDYIAETLKRYEPLMVYGLSKDQINLLKEFNVKFEIVDIAGQLLNYDEFYVWQNNNLLHCKVQYFNPVRG